MYKRLDLVQFINDSNFVGDRDLEKRNGGKFRGIQSLSEKRRMAVRLSGIRLGNEVLYIDKNNCLQLRGSYTRRLPRN